MSEKNTKVAQGTGIAAIVLALVGAAGNYYQAQAVKASASESTKEVARAVAPEVNLLMQRVERLEDRLFRLEDRALDGPPPPAMLMVPAEGGEEPDEDGAALIDVPDRPPPAPEMAEQRPIDMDGLLDKL